MRFPFVCGAFVSHLAAVAFWAESVPKISSVELDSQRLQPSHGLNLTVWASEPQLSNGVAFSWDDQGVCFVAETHRYGRSVFDITQQTNWLLHDLSFRSGEDRAEFLIQTFASNPALLTQDSELVRRLEDPGHVGHATQSTVVAADFNSVLDGTAAGILARDGGLWFGNIPTFWKLNPLTGAKEALATGFGVHIGVTGHDLHGLTFGPDGRIYCSFGDRGLNLTNREGQLIYLPDTGGVLRCEPDGSRLEVYCTGLRNPQELAFDDEGNLWTVDNDTAGPDPCRLLLLLDQGNYGWRCSYQHQEGFGPWVSEELWKGGLEGILPLCGTVSQGPSGLAWYPGTGFGTRLAGKFLHCDFPKGVTAFSVKPAGAGFSVASQEHFLWNCWPTDVEFGPDGAAYVLDWVSGWQMPNKGRIYRITDPEFINSTEVIEVQRILSTGTKELPVPQLWSQLGHRNQRVRQAAQFELARRGLEVVPTLVNRVIEAGPTVQRLHDLWALGQILRKVAPSAEGIESLNRLAALAGTSDPEVAGQALKLLASTQPEGLPGLIEVALKTPTPRLRLHAAEALAVAARRIQPPWEQSSMQPVLIQLLDRKPIDPWIEHAVATVVAEIGNRTATSETRFASWLSSTNAAERRVGILAVRQWAMSALQIGKTEGILKEAAQTVVALLDDPDADLVEEAVHAIHEIPLADGFPDLARLLTRVDLSSRLMSRVIDANLRCGSPNDAKRLAGLAGRREAPESARIMALDALASWFHPPPTDRVNGLWRPLVSGTQSRSLSSTEAEKKRGRSPVLEMRPAAVPVVGTDTVAPIVPPHDLGRSASYADGIAVERRDPAVRRAFLKVAHEILNPDLPDQYGIVLGGPRASEEIQRAVVRGAVTLQLRELSHALTDVFSQIRDTTPLKLTILDALLKLRASESSQVLRGALDSSDPQLQAAALPYLDQLEEGNRVQTSARLVETYLDHPDASPVAAQAALGALGRNGQADADERLKGYLERLSRNAWPATITLDLLEAARMHPATDANRLASRWPSDPSTSTQPADWLPWLSGGNPERGRKLFREQPTVQCLRCHRVGGEGGTVGPALDGIGGRVSREYLMESILFPNTRFAAGFESVSVTLTSGAVVNGIVRSESAQELTLNTVTDEGLSVVRAIPTGEIRTRAPGISAMPEGLAKSLTAIEFRDLIEFLASLKLH